MLILKILSLKNTVDSIEEKLEVAEEWAHDPVKYAKEYIRDFILGYIAVYIFAVLIILGLLTILGFTNLFGGPYQPVQVIVYALLIVVLIIGIILYRAYIKLRRVFKKMIENYQRK